jgi:hypothetical protein
LVALSSPSSSPFTQNEFQKKEKKTKKKNNFVFHFLTHHTKFCVIREFEGCIQKTKLDDSWKTQVHVYATRLVSGL